MKLMLDTSVLIGYLNDQPDVVTRLVAYKSREVCFSSIVLLEALTSVHLGQQRRANRANVAAAGHKYAVAPFDGRAATCAAALFAKHDIKGDRAPVFDGLIAAHAQSRVSTTATAERAIAALRGDRPLDAHHEGFHSLSPETTLDQIRADFCAWTDIYEQERAYAAARIRG